MSRLLRRLSLISLGAFLSAHPLGTIGQQSAPENSVLNAKVPHFNLADQTIRDGLEKVSSGPAPFAFGFEKLLTAKFADSPIPDPRFNLELEGKTVREILDTLCSMDGRYTWSRDDATINVYPWAIIGDTSYLLNSKLDRLDIESITDIDQGLLAIVQQLPPPKEQIAHVQVGGDASFAPEPWTTSFGDLTVRQAINRLAAHMGSHSEWIFYGSHEFREFAFFKRRLPKGS